MVFTNKMQHNLGKELCDDCNKQAIKSVIANFTHWNPNAITDEAKLKLDLGLSEDEIQIICLKVENLLEVDISADYLAQFYEDRTRDVSVRELADYVSGLKNLEGLA